uniref:Uncharacterized protein n=1 Tax=Arundo donax TaxID=35708 RepID=A0A0A9A9S1_ARUDO
MHNLVCIVPKGELYLVCPLRLCIAKGELYLAHIV